MNFYFLINSPAQPMSCFAFMVQNAEAEIILEGEKASFKIKGKQQMALNFLLFGV